jgi:hypothetical protein
LTYRQLRTNGVSFDMLDHTHSAVDPRHAEMQHPFTLVGARCPRVANGNGWKIRVREASNRCSCVEQEQPSIPGHSSYRKLDMIHQFASERCIGKPLRLLATLSRLNTYKCAALSHGTKATPSSELQQLCTPQFAILHVPPSPLRPIQG